MLWSKDLIELLINKFQVHENLYDLRHPLYTDRTKRSNSFFEICREMKEANKDVTVEDIKKKIHNLRTQFVRELREYNSSKRSGVGADEVLEPKLWCFGQLGFLKPHCTIRKSVSNISLLSEANEGDSSFTVDEVYCSEQSVVTEAQPEVNKPANTNKRKRSSILEEGISGVKSLLAKRLQENTQYDWLGKQVVFDINCLKDEQLKRNTVWQIQAILQESLIKDSEITSAATSPQPSTSRNRPVRAHQSNATASPDILQMSLEGILEDEYE